MSWLTYWKARTFITRNQVRVVGESSRFFYFKVEDYDVRIDKNGENNCTCEASSLWAVGETCSHIKAAQKVADSLRKVIK